MLDSVPSGATVTVDGKPLGTTPVELTTLAPGATSTVAFKKPGYQETVMKLEAPKPGADTRVLVPLSVSLDLARVRVTSDPPGAGVIQNGRVLQGVTTPAEILVEAGRPILLVLTMPGKVPATIPIFAAGRGSDNVVKNGKLVDGATLRVTSNIDAKFSIGGLGHCQGLALPAECLMSAGSYVMELSVGTGSRAARLTKAIQFAGTEDREIKLDLGFIEAGPGKVVQIGNGPQVKRAIVDVGSRRVTVTDDAGVLHMTTVNVKPGATAIAN
jgi:hypothetical protein